MHHPKLKVAWPEVLNIQFATENQSQPLQHDSDEVPTCRENILNVYELDMLNLINDDFYDSGNPNGNGFTYF